MNTPRKPAPTWATMEQTLREWHEQSLNDPEFMQLHISFEDMADAVSKAIFNASVEVNEVDMRWSHNKREFSL